MSAVGTILFIAQGEMRAKPDMKPWVHTDKSKMSSVGAALSARAFVLRLGSAAPLGLNKCVPISNPGLTPWALQECRPYRASLRLPYHFTILMRLPCITSPFYLSNIPL